MAPFGPEVAWWGAHVSDHTDKRTHRPPPTTRALPAERPAHVTVVRYTLRSVVLPDVPDWGAGPASGRQRATFHLDGQPFPVTVRLDPGSDATWRATGTITLRDGPSGERPVSFEVAAHGVPDLLRTWTTVPVSTLLRNRDLWLAP